jgi:biotin transport system substrate-specific component
MTLAQAAFGPQTLHKQALCVFGGSLLIAASAQISFGWPVPISLQTLAVLLVGLAFGAKLGAMTVLTYLGYGLMGLPVFANFNNGAAFSGPTAGFLVGFVGMAFLAGMMVERGVKNVFALALGGMVISLLLYIPGAAWAMLADQLVGLDTAKWGAGSFSSIWTYYMAPFLIGDAIKAVLAAMIITGGGAALRSFSK